MSSLVTRFVVIATLLVALAWALPVAADEAAAPQDPALVTAQEGEEQPADEGIDVVPMAVWMIVGVLLFSLVASVFYLLKRRVGGFPRNPAWVAPISIMESKSFPEDGDYGDVPADAHGAHH